MKKENQSVTADDGGTRPEQLIGPKNTLLKKMSCDVGTDADKGSKTEEKQLALTNILMFY